MNTVKQDNYMVNFNDIHSKLSQIKQVGKRLDGDSSNNISKLQVLAIGERSGRALAEIGYPDGTVVLFYLSLSGTSGKDQGMWYPISGFLNKTDKDLTRMPHGWFIKDHGVLDRYGSKTFQGTADYLSANMG